MDDPAHAIAEPKEPGAFSAFERMLALRYLRARREEGFISVIAGFSFLGIMLGVATLIIVMSVMNGFRKELLGKILGLNGHVFVQAIERPLTDWQEVAERIRKAPGVVSAKGMIEGQAFASSPAGGTGVLVRGMRGEDLKAVPAISANIQRGTLDRFDEEKGVAIGSRLAGQLGLSIGDSLSLISPRGTITPFGMTPRIKAYPVVAVFEIGMSEFDGSFVFMPFDEADLYFDKQGEATVIEVFAQRPDRIDAVRAAIEQTAGRPVLLVDWRQRNRTFFSALEIERNVMFVILTLIVLVAALNIISGLIMLVKDKGPAIAILRTMGATRGAIMRVFLMTGASIGIAGTLAGFALGIVFAVNIQAIQRFISWVSGTQLWDPTLRFLSEVPSDIDPGETASVVVMALVLSVLATLYPVEALRRG